MRFVICRPCKVVTYSAALWAGTEECPRCGTTLPSDRRTEQLWVAIQGQISEQLRTHVEHA